MGATQSAPAVPPPRKKRVCIVGGGVAGEQSAGGRQRSTWGGGGSEDPDGRHGWQGYSTAVWLELGSTCAELCLVHSRTTEQPASPPRAQSTVLIKPCRSGVALLRWHFSQAWPALGAWRVSQNGLMWRCWRRCRTRAVWPRLARSTAVSRHTGMWYATCRDCLPAHTHAGHMQQPSQQPCPSCTNNTAVRALCMPACW